MCMNVFCQKGMFPFFSSCVMVGFSLPPFVFFHPFLLSTNLLIRPVYSSLCFPFTHQFRMHLLFCIPAPVLFLLFFGLYLFSFSFNSSICPLPVFFLCKLFFLHFDFWITYGLSFGLCNIILISKPSFWFQPACLLCFGFGLICV